MRRTLFVCLFMAFAGGALLAQDISGTIEGTVLDPSNAPVPRAKVTIKNTDRNLVVRTIVTDTGGNYSAPLIPIGNYAITVEAAGFKKQDHTGIVLNVNDDLKINLVLQVGAITETVEVKAQGARVELGSPASATTIEGTQVRELTLNTRNYEQLVSLMPGVSANTTDELYIGNSAPSGFAATLPYSINGNRNSANNWTVDGVDNVDRGSNQTLMTFPSVDAISEFKVERSQYTADTGRAGGAQINVVTKSGNSSFHGSLYEFFRNDALAANNWENNAAKVNVVNGVAKVPALRWNDFGGSIGGPVFIPGHYNKDKNKTFFFFSEEARRIHTYTTLAPTLPTQGMLAGQFSQPVCISYTTSCQQTATSIPSSLINANAAAYIKDIFSKLSLSSVNTVAATTSTLFPVQNIYNSRQEIARVDQVINENFTIWGKFENDSIPTTEPGGLFTGSAIPYVATTNTNSPGRSAAIHFQNIIHGTLINDAGFNYSQSAINSTPAGLLSKSQSPDINPSEPFANTQGVVPELTFTGGSSLLGFGPYNEYNKNFAWFDNLNWIHGRHNLRFGFSMNRYNKTENAAGAQYGAFGFSNLGGPTGTTSFQQSWANFLLGNVATFSMASTDITPDLWAWQHEAYAQDDFKVTPRLTIFMGVRWSFFGQPSDSHGILDNFDPGLYVAANAPKIDSTTGNIIPGTGTNPSTNGIIVGGKTSPFGDKIAPNKYDNFAPRISLAWDPTGSGKTAIRAGYGVFYDSTLFGGYEQNTFANPPFVQSVSISNASFSNVAGGTVGVSAAPLVLHATQLPANVPYSQQWSFDIQRNLASDFIIDLAYVGTKGTHLLGYVDINQAPPGAALAAGLHAANGNTVFTTADDPRINAIRPYLGFNAINTIESAFDSNYNSLQFSARKVIRSGGVIALAYTYSKTLTDNSSDRSNAPQNSYNWHEGEYGPASFDRKQIMTLNYVYPLPFLRGHSMIDRIAGGWQFSGIVSASSGLPSTVTTSSVDSAGLGLLGSSAASARPDMVCDPNANAPHQFNGIAASGNPIWFNTACFQPTPQGAVRPGNTGRYTVRGPGYFNWDAALMKEFGLSKEGRVRMQIRGEGYNYLNWVNPSGFASTNITSTSFGEINSFRAARRVQLAAKITF